MSNTLNQIPMDKTSGVQLFLAPLPPAENVTSWKLFQAATDSHSWDRLIKALAFMGKGV